MKFKLFVFVLLLICFSTLDFIGESSITKNNIGNKGKMVVAVDTLNGNYYVNKGEPAGYQLELLKNYTQKSNLIYEMLPVADKYERLEMLQNGTVDIAVFSEADSLNHLSKSHKNIYASIPLDDTNNSIWAVKKGNEQAIIDVNLWITDLKETQQYRFWQLRYLNQDFTGTKGKISSYDHLFKKYSEEIGWDWRLLAAISCQESRFNPTVQSRRGAYGLMQIMPQTAKFMGFDDVSHPETNVRAGVKLIKWLQQQMDKENIPEEEQIKFILSAYNAGIGRVQDSRNLARSQGKDADKWDEVKKVVPLMRQPEHYQGKYMKYGKFRGDETLRYVDQVLDRYYHYMKLVPA